MSPKQPNDPVFTQNDGPGVRRFAESTMLKRLWYFDGRFLDAADFRTEQNYVRNLTALSHQANGHGVVRGLDVARSKSGLAVTAGLAINADGDVILLPERVDLDVAELIGAVERPSPAATKARSLTKREQAERKADAKGSYEFAPCSPADESPADEVRPATGYWVLSAAPANTLCGEEESFANPCASACETGTDRSFVLEGVAFRVRRYSPGVDIPGGPDDLARGVVASAWFKAERARRRRKMSASVLDDGFWCEGATASSGNEVDLAILCHQGGSTKWVDQWTVRRELCESSPKNYWFHAMDMRPWSEFIAQVNQFQCQLAECRPQPAEPEAERQLRELVSLSDQLVAEAAKPGASALAQSTKLFATRLRQIEVASFAAPTGSSLIRKCVGETLPPCGWLPLIEGSDACASAETWLGKGVIGRYLTVRRDYIGQAFQEAQHLDRISLSEKNQVDILIPEGPTESADWIFFVRRRATSVHPCDAPAEEGGGSSDTAEEVAILTFNAAPVSLLEAFPDIGPKIAREIIDVRVADGPFTSFEQMDVRVSRMNSKLATELKENWSAHHEMAALDELAREEYGIGLLDLVNDSSKQGAQRRRRLAGVALKKPFAKPARRDQHLGATGARRAWTWDMTKLERIDEVALELPGEAQILDELRRFMPALGGEATWAGLTGEAESERGLFKVLALWLNDKVRGQAIRDLSAYRNAPESKKLKTSLDLATELARLPIMALLTTVLPGGVVLGTVGLVLLTNGIESVFPAKPEDQIPHEPDLSE